MSDWWLKYPLPEGWEIKYHWESKRFLYIDHASKVTAWVDPRIELYREVEERKLEEINENYDDGSSKSSSEESDTYARLLISRENKSKVIQKKFPNFSLEKIMTLLESNYDNEFSVESKLDQEHRQLLVKAEAEKRRKEEEEEKRIKEETIRKQEAIKKEEIKKKRDEEMKRIEEQKKRVEDEMKRKEEETKKEAKDQERKILEEKMKQRLDQENKMKLEEEEEKRNVKVKEESYKSSTMKMQNTSNNQPPIYENNNPTYSGQFDILKKEYKSVYQRGPDKSLLSGADPLNVKGSNDELLSDRGKSLAKGPDPLNRCGPQSRKSCAVFQSS